MKLVVFILVGGSASQVRFKKKPHAASTSRMKLQITFWPHRRKALASLTYLDGIGLSARNIEGPESQTKDRKLSAERSARFQAPTALLSQRANVSHAALERIAQIVVRVR